MRTALAGLLVTLTTAGCVALVRSDDPSLQHNDSSSVLMLYVENNQWPDMDIYVDGGIGMPQLVGSVRGKSEGYFELSKALFYGIDQVRLIADPFGSTQHMISEPLDVSSQSVRWRINSTGSTRLFSM